MMRGVFVLIQVSPAQQVSVVSLGEVFLLLCKVFLCSLLWDRDRGSP